MSLRRTVKLAAVRTAGTRARLPPPPRLQLAATADLPPAGPEWLHEIKFDGYRIAAVLAGGRVRLTTRNLLDWTAKFPQVAEAVAALDAQTAVIDGEVIATAADDRSSFSLLQQYLSSRSAAAGTTLSAGVNVRYQAFDLLELDGRDLRALPLEQRKRLLKELLDAASRGAPTGALRFTEHLEAPGNDVIAAACRLGLEGVISKRRDSPYRPGRSEDWLKSTCLASGDFVIGGFTAPRGSRAGFGALLLGERDQDGRLRYVGKVGTGFDDRTLQALTGRLTPLASAESPFATQVPKVAVASGVTWLEPRLLAEVLYATRTRAGMLRQARFHSLREDKVAADEARSNMQVAGVNLTNPDRVLYADQGITKRRLAEYYRDVGEELLRWAAFRPLSLVRCPEGSESECFYQKHPGAGFAADLPRVPIEESDGTADYVYLESVEHLVALVQVGVLEIHAWNSRVDDLERPDMLVFDLDPSEGVDFDFTKDTALQLRDLLSRLGLASFLRATGGKGLHVVVPLKPAADWDAVKTFAHAVARTLADTDPGRLTTNMAKAKRVDKLFIDYLRNGRGATAITNYSTRSRLGAPVAVPLRWNELAGLTAANSYDIGAVRRRLKALKSDPWEGFEAARRPLPTSAEAPQ